MSSHSSLDRFGGKAENVALAPGWTVRRLGHGARMLGANGMRPGPDGRLYVAQAVGSQISAINVDDGEIETIAPVGCGILAPDDLAFDSHGTMFATEVLDGRVSARSPNGQTRVIAGDIPSANGISIHDDRMFVDEFRAGGRMWEVYRDGSAPRLIAENLQFPNALALGDDGYIYYPAVLAGEIWRVAPAGGEPQRIIGGLSSPVAVKFDQQGSPVVVNAGSGDIVRIDLQQGRAVTIATTRPGLDNLAFMADGRLFVSHFSDGGVSELLAGGGERVVVPPAFLGPWGLALDTRGALYVADGLSLATIDPSGEAARIASMLRGAGWPGFVRSLVIRDDGAIIIGNSRGTLSLYEPGLRSRVLASGLGEIMGMALAPDGSVLLCDAGNGAVVRVAEGETSTVARDLGRPADLALHSTGALFVTDMSGGRLLRIDQRGATTVADDFINPHGVAIHAGHAYVVDRGDRSLVEIALDGSVRRKIAWGLPLGQKSDLAEDAFDHPANHHGSFSALACGAAGRLFVSADGDGSVLSLERGPPG